MAGVLRNDRPADASGAPGLPAGVPDVDAVARSVDLFVMRAVEALCLAEATVPAARRSTDMRMRLDEAKRCIARLEDTLVEIRRKGVQREVE